MDASFFELESVVVARELIGKLLTVTELKAKKNLKQGLLKPKLTGQMTALRTALASG